MVKAMSAMMAMSFLFIFPLGISICFMSCAPFVVILGLLVF